MNSNTNSIIINGNRLHYIHSHKYPERPTIVFLHDSLGCAALWRDFPNKLGMMVNCNVLVYDRLGYGISDPMPDIPRPVTYMEPEVDTLIELLEKLEIKNPILFGHSDGASIALLATAKYPDRIRAVISEAAHVFVEEITLKGIKDAANAYKTTDLRARLEKYHGSNTDVLFRAWADTWTRSDFRQWNIEHFLPHITCPVLVIQGTKDEFGSMAQVNSIINKVSGTVQKVLIPAAGHTPHKEPQQTLDTASDFIIGL